MSKFRNSKKSGFLSSIPTISLEESDTAYRCSFCFSFLDSNQEAGQDFSQWDASGGALSTVGLLNKLKDFTRESLEYWENQGQKPLVIYSKFPSSSDFIHPKHVPHDVRWGRFRLGSKVRLVGFIIPESLDGKEVNIKGNTYRLSRNTFYVVFLDKDHRFYKTEKP